jgi:hypothetical protein
MSSAVRSKRRRPICQDWNAVPTTDLVRRKFAAAAPDKLWLADIT